MEGEKQGFADPSAEAAAHPERELEQTTERAADQARRAGDLTLDAGEHGLVQTRHGDHDGAAMVVQRVHDLRPGNARRQNHRGADRKRREQADGQRIGVVQRQW
jgi:hypothetical protein